MFQLLALTTLACGAWLQAPRLEEFARQVASLNISGHSFRVTARIKRLPGTRDPDFGETVAAVEIRDAAGRVHFRRTLPYEVAGERFAETAGVEARAIGGRGLLLTYSFLPSAPLGGDSWQVLGMIGGRLVPFSKPIGVYGTLRRAGEDALEFGVWTTNFFVIVPVALDWDKGRLIPPLAGRQFGVEAERRPPEEAAEIRLFPRPGAAAAARVAVRKDSAVEFLAAQATLRWEEQEEEIGLDVSEEVWLKVCVDGKEGWMQGEADFHAIGLPSAG
ncbi:MAG: hypothetical protein AAB225_09755 [Acidobacteriota bacterium]